MKYWIISIVLIAVVGCAARDTSVQNRAQVQGSAGAEMQLKADLSAADFEQALIGMWTSVFTHESKPTIQSVAFRSDGTASLVIVRSGVTEEHRGTYSLTYDREPSAGAVTFATITIEQEDADPIVLSRVNFGLHSGVPLQVGPVLRIDREPYGALERAD